MNRKKIKNALSKGPAPERLLETQRLCVKFLNERQADAEEERTSFWTFLSSVFKHIGLRLWGMQLLILIVACASVLSLPDVFQSVPFFTPPCLFWHLFLRCFKIKHMGCVRSRP